MKQPEERELVHQDSNKNSFLKVIQVITKMRFKNQIGSYWYGNNCPEMVLCDLLLKPWNDFSHKAFTDIYKEL